MPGAQHVLLVFYCALAESMLEVHETPKHHQRQEAALETGPTEAPPYRSHFVRDYSHCFLPRKYSDVETSNLHKNVICAGGTFTRGVVFILQVPGFPTLIVTMGQRVLCRR